MENLFDLRVVKHGFLDLPAGVLVVEGEGFAGSWKRQRGRSLMRAIPVFTVQHARKRPGQGGIKPM